MNSERLTSAQRMKALTNREGLDRIPVNAGGGHYAAIISGITLREFFLNPALAFDVQMWAAELHQYDGSPSYGVPGWGGWDFGNALDFPSSPRASFPRIIKKAVEHPSDVEKLEIPDLEKAPAFEKALEFARLARTKGLGVSVAGGSPMGIATSILGPGVLLRWLYKEPDLVHRVLRLSTDYLIKRGNYFIKEFGAENCSVFSTYPMECHAVVSPKVFGKFSLPYVREIHQTFMSQGIKRWRIHLCGDHTRNLPYWINDIPLMPRTTFTLGHEMDIVETAKRLGDEYIIGGNVPTDLLYSGTPDEVFQVCKSLIEKMKYNPGGFILMPACGLPALTPPVNVHAMVRAGRMLGQYDF